MEDITKQFTDSDITNSNTERQFTDDEIKRRFYWHPPLTIEDQVAHSVVRELFINLVYEMNNRLPDGREKSIVMKNLEDALMYANASIARGRFHPAESGDEKAVLMTEAGYGPLDLVVPEKGI